jgi:hypothetical protein
MPENGSESLPFEPPEQENIRLREENARLRRLLAVHSIAIPQPAPENPPPAKTVETAPPVDKEERARKRIALFRNLFRGREDVYARRWENDDGRYGYRLRRGPQVVLLITHGNRRQSFRPFEVPDTITAGAGGTDLTVRPWAKRHPHGPAEGDGQHCKAMIVDVLANQVHSAWSRDHLAFMHLSSEGLADFFLNSWHAVSIYNKLSTENIIQS